MMIWGRGNRLALRVDWTDRGWRITPKGANAALAGLTFGAAGWWLPYGPRVPVGRVLALVAGTAARLNADGPVAVFVGARPPVRLNAE